ncbi:unnamed protein product [Caenorhabditis nigoni]
MMTLYEPKRHITSLILPQEVRKPAPILPASYDHFAISVAGISASETTFKNGERNPTRPLFQKCPSQTMKSQDCLRDVPENTLRVTRAPCSSTMHSLTANSLSPPAPGNVDKPM